MRDGRCSAGFKIERQRHRLVLVVCGIKEATLQACLDRGAATAHPVYSTNRPVPGGAPRQASLEHELSGWAVATDVPPNVRRPPFFPLPTSRESGNLTGRTGEAGL